jgi:hypothetical protein
MSADKPYKLEPTPSAMTILEIIEMFGKAVESWDLVEKAIFRASLTGRLGPTSERIQ